MKRVEAKSVDEIINEVLRQERLSTRLDEHRAMALWPDVVGPGINKYTVSRTVKNGVMTVVISSAPLRQQLMMSRTALIKQLNDFLGGEVITDIVFK